MSSTIMLSDSINFAQPFIQFRPLAGGVMNEPALTMGDVVMQMMLAPPFTWRWNRKVLTSFNTVAGQQDYTKSVPDLGFVEKVSVGGKETEAKTILGTAATT